MYMYNVHVHVGVISRGLLLSMLTMYSIKGAGDFSSCKQRFPLNKVPLYTTHKLCLSYDYQVTL